MFLKDFDGTNDLYYIKVIKIKMKIKFIIGQPPINVVSSWKNIQKHKYTQWTFSEESYGIYKALEICKIFQEEITTSRKKLKISPKGLNWSIFKKHYPNLDSASFPGLQTEVARIEKKLIINDFVKIQLKNLILSNFVEPTCRPCSETKFNYWIPKPNKTYTFEPDKNQPSLVSINIFYNSSRNEFNKFLDKNWSQIQQELKTLNNKKDFYLTNNEIKIVKLKDFNNLNAKNISTVPNPSSKKRKSDIARINKIYERAKEKINELVRLK